MKKIACVLSLLLALCVGTVAHAQLTLTGAGKGAPAGGGGGSAIYTVEDASQTPTVQFTSPYTFTGVTFNTGASDVAGVEIVSDNNGGTITGVTIGGHATTCVFGNFTFGGSQQAGICYASAGTLTTANVAITFTGTGINVSIATFKVATTTPTPFDSQTPTQTGNVSTPYSFSANVPANGVGVGVLGDFMFGGSGNTCTVAPTNSFGINNSNGNETYLCGGVTTAAGSPSTLTATLAGAGSYAVAAAMVTWGP